MIKTTSALFATLLVSGVIFSGCATITDGPKQKVMLKTSNNEQVVVTINNEKVTIPTVYNLPRKTTEIHVYAEDNPGYQTSSLSSTSSGGMDINPKYWLNMLGVFAFLLPGLTSAIVDTSTGSAYKYANDQIIIPVYKAAK